MPDYLDLNFKLDPEELRGDAEDFLLANAPTGFQIDPLTDWIISACARMSAELAILAGLAGAEIFRAFGQRVLGIPTVEATVATGVATFTMTDDDGYTVASGAQLLVEGQEFVTIEDLTVPAMSTTGDVPVEAVLPGAESNGLSGPADLVAPTLIYVDSVSLGVTTGGTAAESPEEYLDRLPDELPTLSPKAILINDFALLARRDIEVFRALALDNFVPPSTTGVEGAVTVALQNATGLAVSAPAKARVEAQLEADRVLGLQVHVIDATYSTIKVSATVEAFPGYSSADIEARVEAALAAFLSPALWGAEGSPEVWLDEPLVSRNDLIGAVYKVQGVRHVSALTLAEGADALATTDLTLDGPAPLPLPGVISVTVS